MPSFLAEQTLIWYEENARDLPWRHKGVGAWAILVSEVMLQQTPVSRVLPVYREWIDRWPSPAALAAQTAGDAIRAWGRLGYPRRAMRLHECAVAIVQRHGGEVPAELDKLLALPGIGDYTARAVLSFAFGQRHAVVDTNVRRVVARAQHGVEDRAIPLAEVAELLPHKDSEAAAASAALMELGAMVCTARNPRCGACPVAGRCAWKRLGSPLPEKPFRKPQSYAGTDRQVRGLLLAVLREASTPVPRHRLDVVWPDVVQRERALQSLLADGLVKAETEDLFLLPNSKNAQ